MELENKSICSKCGGLCCKRNGCIYSTENFKSIDFDTIQKVLDSGKASITAELKCYSEFLSIYLYLRARELNKGKIDLVSYPDACASLTENGCTLDLENRPLGGVYLIPKEYHDCGYLIKSLKSIIDSWMPYQDLLKELVEKNTNMTLEERVRFEVEEMFYYQLKYENEAKVIATDIKKLYNAFPEELKKADERYYRNHPRLTLEHKLMQTF